MLDKFKKYIEEEQLFEKEERILIAVSGGVDSIVLCVLMKQAELNFGIAHCNFKLRGEASEGDEAFVKQVADFLQVPLFLKYFDTNKIAVEEKESIQIAARRIRYAWFEELLEREKFDYLATAHHLNDSIETVIYNFSKGCGIRGMHGILPKKNNIIRPLSFATKEEIVSYAKQLELTWREDISNASDKYIRNHIRLNIIPQIKQINNNFEKHSERTIRHLRDAEVLMDFALEKMKEEAYKKEGKKISIDIEKILSFPASQTVLYEMIRAFGFNGAQVEQVFQTNFSQSGKLFFSPTHQMLLGRTQIIIQEQKERGTEEIFIEEGTEEVIVEGGILKLKYNVSPPKSFPSERNLTYFDLEKLTFPLKLRRWKKGDIFQPLGMKGKHRKLSDFMIDQKMSRFEKDALWILESGGVISLLLGRRPDDRFKLSKKTKTCLFLDWETE